LVPTSKLLLKSDPFHQNRNRIGLESRNVIQENTTRNGFTYEYETLEKHLKQHLNDYHTIIHYNKAPIEIILIYQNIDVHQQSTAKSNETALME
jgi:hypothetical protein